MRHGNKLNEVHVDIGDKKNRCICRVSYLLTIKARIVRLVKPIHRSLSIFQCIYNILISIGSDFTEAATNGYGLLFRHAIMVIGIQIEDFS
ncbi:hypothetical protein BpHYR1_024949 [Brachionus plicatilis]|uniref:Uncharacterized protein n=1 Tax=Brachionus plicatilis TaxID=10195 RepID=A0A3M7PF75_BRAPC|nr:hypothetical protein BpHYR1_024949 [Brachionus plicatilis]